MFIYNLVLFLLARYISILSSFSLPNTCRPRLLHFLYHLFTVPASRLVCRGFSTYLFFKVLTLLLLFLLFWISIPCSYYTIQFSSTYAVYSSLIVLTLVWFVYVQLDHFFRSTLKFVTSFLWFLCVFCLAVLNMCWLWFFYVLYYLLTFPTRIFSSFLFLISDLSIYNLVVNPFVAQALHEVPSNPFDCKNTA